MPPFVPRKRPSTSPPPARPAKRTRLTDALDAETRNTPNLKKTKTFSVGSDDSDSSLSDVDSDEFEDVPRNFKQSMQAPVPHQDAESEEDIEWEDAAPQGSDDKQKTAHTSLASGNIQLTFRNDDDGPDYGTAAAATAGKKGPSKREKEVRILTHQLHVQFLLWHNSIRNMWICDKTVQDVLVRQLPPQIKKEVEKWRRASGLVPQEPIPKAIPEKSKKKSKQRAHNVRAERDWGKPSQKLEPGKPDLSHGDPLIPLLKVLSAYWKKRFAITAPGLRKRGYGTKQGLKKDIASFRNDEHDPEKHGERIRDLHEFRHMAEKCEGSRDAGAQLFTALLRGLGIESRLVASFQPSGYGWTKAEQMVPKKVVNDFENQESSSDEENHPASVAQSKPKTTATGESKKASTTRSRRSTGGKDKPIDLDTDLGSDKAEELEDDDSVVDITPSLPKGRPAKYDRELAFPIYWTEAISPITHKVVPVSPLVLASPVGSIPEVLATFEPRGAKADKGRQVMAYVVAYSSDGTAKDVTVRYLRKQLWPGKTKGSRLPTEKIPVYDKRGKIKRHEDCDWFKRIMSGYVRRDHTRTAVDDVEDADELVPKLPEKDNDQKEDTLQSLKSSAEFVLERFLRREEALKPGSTHVKTFKSGKGENVKEEKVYRRADVERCLTAESWHKEGRRPKESEAPMKLVPVRAVTLTRKREAEEYERQTGQKQMQGLYAWDQCEYIIPPPIKDGVIPKNSYGNMDCFVPSMVPRGAVHIPLRGTVRICKKLEIDFAEAVTGFEFGNKRAVPVCTGVVVAVEHEKKVREAWKVYNEEQRKKEETKMEKLVLDLWRKFVMGLRIRERVEEAYGEDDDAEELDLSRGMTKEEPIDVDEDEEDNKPAKDDADDVDMGGGFLLPEEDEGGAPEDLVMEDHNESRHLIKPDPAAEQYPTPGSLSPLRVPVRRQRQGKSLLHDSEDTSESGLSDLSDDEKANIATKQSARSRMTDVSVPATDVRPRLGQSISVEIAKPTYKLKSSASTAKKTSKVKPKPTSKTKKSLLAADSSELDVDSEEDSNPAASSSKPEPLLRADMSEIAVDHVSNDNTSQTHDHDDSDTAEHGTDTDTDTDTDAYTPKPMSRPRTAHKAKPTPVQPASVSRARTRSTKAKEASAANTTRRSKQNGKTAAPRRTPRLRTRESTLVTSPYFDGDGDGDGDGMSDG